MRAEDRQGGWDGGGDGELAVRDDSNPERFVFLLWGPLHFRRLAKDSEIWEELGLR